MMLKPYMSDLLKKVDNRYLLVNITAKRARDIADKKNLDEEETGEIIKDDEKPVSIALREIESGKINVIKKHSEDSEQ